MTTARCQLVDPASAGFYHCVSRCVRRAWLCGFDALSNRSFEHRRGWIEQRMLELSGIFAVGIYAYAVMSNHVHIVLRLDPQTAQAWTDAEVAQRWVRLFPARVDGCVDATLCHNKEQALLGQADRLAECRRRLGGLAWFMRCLNEPIARRANQEDTCTGRFWEGRYKCQALLDEAALLACMSYVDLNPIRAGLADDLPSSVHTGAARRVVDIQADKSLSTSTLAPWGLEPPHPPIDIDAARYLELIDWTARQLRPDKPGRVDAQTPAVLKQLGLPASTWQTNVVGIENRNWRVIGRAQAILDKAKTMGQRWLKGIGDARQIAGLVS